MSKHLNYRLLLCVVFALWLPVAGGCDSDEDTQQSKDPQFEKLMAERNARAAANKNKAGGSVVAPDGRVQIVYENPQWRDLQPYFTNFSKGSVKNIFSPNTSTFIDRPELPKELAGAVEGDPVAEPVPIEAAKITGLQAYDLKTYKLVMIISGTTVNKALVLDGAGKQYFIERGMRIGNKGGVIKAITQYTVFVSEPDSEKLSKMDIEPAFIGLESKPDGDESEAGELALPPGVETRAAPTSSTPRPSRR